jgi:CheY-like chemotaxis protein
VLHLEDDANDAELIASWLADAGIRCEFQRVETRPDYEQLLANGKFDLIFADQTTPSFDGLSALSLAQKLRSEVPFIFVSGTLDEEVAITSLRNGATDYVLKHRLARLIPAVERAMAEQARRRELAQAGRAVEEQAELLDLANDMILIRDMDHQITSGTRGRRRFTDGRNQTRWGRMFTSYYERNSLNRRATSKRNSLARATGKGNWCNTPPMAGASPWPVAGLCDATPTGIRRRCSPSIPT